MEDRPFVSVIIPVRNVEKIIGRCLESLGRLNYPKDKYEIIISDSESDDQTEVVVKKHKALYTSTPRRSCCAGRNNGFKIAKGEIIAFSDADCVMDENWIKNSLKYFTNPSIAGVGGPNITPPKETAFAKAVGFVFDQAIFSAGSIHGRILKKPRQVKSLPGCNMIFRRAVLDKVMPVDEAVLGGEDYVLNQKIRQLGYKLVYTPDTFVWHYHRTTPRKFYKQMYRYGISRLLIGKKNLKMMNLIHITTGFGIPILILFSSALIYINPLYFFYFASLGILFLLIYFFLGWFKLKSIRAAVFVPYAITILFISWSMGFLRELFYPIKEGE